MHDEYHEAGTGKHGCKIAYALSCYMMFDLREEAITIKKYILTPRKQAVFCPTVSELRSMPAGVPTNSQRGRDSGPSLL